MQWYSLDQIVRGLLLKSGLPVHYYLQFLTHGCDALKRLNTTTSKNINTKLLPVSTYKSVTLPCDYVDWVMVGMAVGERVRPLIYDSSLNRLNNYDSQGNKIPYQATLPDGTVYGLLDEVSDWYSGLDTLNYPFFPYISPYFGHDPSRDDYKFKVLPERNEIQLSATYPYQYIVLEYITDGLEADAATMIDPLAQPAIEKYILWQKEVHSRSSNDSIRAEAERRFNSEWRFLRSARNNLTKSEIIAAVHSGYSPLPK